MTMMPVRSHKETPHRVPRGSEAPSKSKGFSLFGGRGTTNAKMNGTFNNKSELDTHTRQPVTRHNTNGIGRSEANKESLWQSLFRPKSSRHPAPTTTLNRSATTGGGLHRRPGSSHGRRSSDGLDSVIYEERKPRQTADYLTTGDSRYTQAPSTTRGFMGHVDSMNLDANRRGRPLRRADTSYAEPSSTGWYIDGSDLEDGVYRLVEEDTSRDPQSFAYEGSTGSSYGPSSYGPTMRYCDDDDDDDDSQSSMFRSNSHRTRRW